MTTPLKICSLYVVYFNGSNNANLGQCKFGTNLGQCKFCSRHGYFELMSVNHSARSGGIIGIFFRVSLILRYVVVFIRIALSRQF